MGIHEYLIDFFSNYRDDDGNYYGVNVPIMTTHLINCNYNAEDVHGFFDYLYSEGLLLTPENNATLVSAFFDFK